MKGHVLVTGGTGTLGRLLVPMLREAGAPVRVLSRRHDAGRDGGGGVEHVAGDLSTGAGVRDAVVGAEVIVHCAGSAKGDDVKTRHLVQAAAAAGRAHLVYISVVGADRVPVSSALDRAMFGYYLAKRASERIVEGSGLPFTTLRATQFHDLILTVLEGMARLPIIPVPAGLRFQPVDASEVAARLAELALGAPAGLVPDVAGPHTHELRTLLREHLRATGRRRLVVPIPLPGAAARAIRAGAHLAPDRAVGRRTWEEFVSRSRTRQRTTRTENVGVRSAP